MTAFPVEEVMAICVKHGGMASPYHTLEAMAQHPQTIANDMIITVEHATLGELRMIGMPSRFDGSPAEVVLPPPTLAQHTLEILREARYTDAEIEDLLLHGGVG